MGRGRVSHLGRSIPASALPYVLRAQHFVSHSNRCPNTPSTRSLPPRSPLASPSGTMQALRGRCSRARDNPSGSARDTPRAANHGAPLRRARCAALPQARAAACAGVSCSSSSSDPRTQQKQQAQELQGLVAEAIDLALATGPRGFMRGLQAGRAVASLAAEYATGGVVWVGRRKGDECDLCERAHCGALPWQQGRQAYSWLAAPDASPAPANRRSPAPCCLELQPGAWTRRRWCCASCSNA